MRIFELKNYVEKGIVHGKSQGWGLGGGTLDHSHDCFEMDYFYSGSLKYWVNGFEYDACPGMLFLNSPADFHHEKEIGGKGCHYSIMFPCAVFEPELLYALFSPETPSFFLIPEKDRPMVESLFLEVIQLAEKEPENALHFLRCILLKVFQLISNSKKRPDSHVQSAIVYILEHFRSGITLQSAAEHIGLAPAYLSTLFRQETGYTFKGYVDSLRFYYAAHLLHTTDLPATEVCAYAGFNDYVNFSRRFRQKFGKSPRNLRK